MYDVGHLYSHIYIMYDVGQLRVRGQPMLNCWTFDNFICYSPLKRRIKSYNQYGLSEIWQKLSERVLEEGCEYEIRREKQNNNAFTDMCQAVVKHADQYEMTHQHKLLYLTLRLLQLRSQFSFKSALFNWFKQVSALFPPQQNANQDVVLKHLRNMDLMALIAHISSQNLQRNDILQLCIEHLQQGHPKNKKIDKTKTSFAERVLSGDLDSIKQLSLGSWPLYLTLLCRYGQFNSDNIKKIVLSFTASCNKLLTNSDHYLVELASYEQFNVVYQMSLSLLPPALCHLIAFKQLKVFQGNNSVLALDPQYKQNILRNLLDQTTKISKQAAINALSIYASQFPFYCLEVQLILLSYVQFAPLHNQKIYQQYVSFLTLLNKKQLSLYSQHFAKQILLYSCKRLIINSYFLHLYCFSVDSYAKFELSQLQLFLKRSLTNDDLDLEAVGQTLQILKEQYPDQSAHLQRVFDTLLTHYRSQNEPTQINRIKAIKKHIFHNQLSIRTLREIQSLLMRWEQDQSRGAFITLIIKYLQRNRSKFTKKHLAHLNRIGDLLM